METDKETNKEKEKRGVPSNNKEILTPAQIQKRKKMLVYPVLFLVFAGSIYLIFSPSDKQERQNIKGFNAELPKPKEEGIVGDKMKAYQDEQMNEKKEEKMRTLQDFTMATGMQTSLPITANGQGNVESSSVASSTEAYQKMNKQLTSFYQPAKASREESQDMLALEYRIQELENRLKAGDRKKSATNEQLELMEKSYQMAAKYMGPEKQSQTVVKVNQEKNTLNELPSGVKVTAFREKVVSGLSQPVSDSMFISQYSKPRNYGFHTAVGSGEVSIVKNSIKACVYQTQVITDGQVVKLRLLESLQAGKVLIPENALVSGISKLQGERLEIQVSSLEYHGNIIPVELTVYDMDGQAGLFVPGSMEGDAARETMGNIGSGLGTSISFAQSAGQQIAMDLTRGVMQGASTYLGKKLRQVKIRLKAGHQLYLVAKEK
jgi:conjugative transposon TraM protein